MRKSNPAMLGCFITLDFSSHPRSLLYSSSFTPPIHTLANEELVDPCRPSPCGPYSTCRVADGRPVCSCQANYFGAPPYCRPECTINSECARDKACQNQRCVDPCPGTCGYNAICRVVNHNPICTCHPGYIGDPFTHCRLEDSKHNHSQIHSLPHACILYTQTLFFLSSFSRI